MEPQRLPLTPTPEQLLAEEECRRLLRLGMHRSAIATRLGRSQPWVLAVNQLVRIEDWIIECRRRKGKTS